MKKFLITMTLAVLLSVNVLTPMTYATGDLSENGSGMSENGSEMSENGSDNFGDLEGNSDSNSDGDGNGSDDVGNPTGDQGDDSSQQGVDDLIEDDTTGSNNNQRDDQSSTDDAEILPGEGDGDVDSQDPVVLPLAQPMPAMSPLKAPMLRGPVSPVDVTLIAGSDFNDIIENNFGKENIKYIKQGESISDDAKDISADGNSGVVVWFDGDTLYYKGGKWVLNADSSWMFSGFANLVSIEGIESRDVSNVVTMEDMFHGCESIESLDLSSWNVSGNLKNIKAIFTECKGMKSVKLPDFSSATITSMSHMFHQNFELTSIDGLNTIDTSNVTTMRHMFSRASSIEVIDLSNWDTSSVSDMESMFERCTNLKTIYVSDAFSTSQLTKSTKMFDGDTKLVGGYGTKYDSSKVDSTYAKIDRGTTKGYFSEKDKTYVVFHKHRKLGGTDEIETVEIGQTVSEKDPGTHDGYTFEGWYDNPELSGDPFDFSAPITAKVDLYQSWSGISQETSMFLKGTDFKSKIGELTAIANINYIERSNKLPAGVEYVILSTDDTTPVYAWYNDGTLYYYSESNTIYLNANSSNMFNGFSNLESIDMSGWDTSRVTTMQQMFDGCTKLKELDLSSWDTSNVINMKQMFRNCYKLEKIKGIENFNTENVTDTSFMFLNCIGLQELDLTNWDMHNVSQINQMFARNNDSEVSTKDYQLKTIYVSSDKFIIKSTATESEGMFGRARHLVGGNGTTWYEVIPSGNWGKKQYAIVDGSGGKAGFFTDASLPRITFNTKGATVTIPSKAVQFGGKITKPTEYLESVGGTFTYQWYVSGTDEERDFDNDTVSESMTLYAGWDCRVGYTLNSDKVCVIDTQGDRDRQETIDFDVYFIGNSSNVYHETLMDRNMGATAVYTGENNVDTYGYYYQWGNNYGFRYEELNNGEAPIIYNQVPYSVWSNYAPSTYATGVFVAHESNWQEGGTSDSNLWGGAGDSLSKDGAGTKANRQGPCPDGYYIPSAKDLNLLLNEWKDIAQDSNDYQKFAKDLLLPLAGHVNKNEGYLMSYGSEGYLWSSSPARSDGSYRFAFRYDQFNLGSGMQRSSADPIRCFKNIDNTSLSVYPNGGVKAMVSILDNKKIHHLGTPKHPEGREFRGWYTTPNFLNGTNVNTGDDITGKTGLYARWEGDEEAYVITFVNEDGTELQKVEVASGVTPSYSGTPTKESDKDYTYIFDKWEPEIVPVTGDAKYTATYTAKPISSGGGGTILKKDKCPDGDYSDSYYDGDCGEKENSEDGGDEEQTHGSAGEENGYTDEELLAYEWAYKNGITNMPTIKEADMDGYIIRSHLAKMMSQFAINVMGAKPNIGKEGCDKFNDIAAETDELKGYMKTACELGLMGLHADGKTVKNNFDPNDYVTRAEFGTVLSRFLYLDENNLTTQEIQEGVEWYSKHLSALKLNGIMTQIDRPLTRKELRKRIWVMLKRISENKNIIL